VGPPRVSVKGSGAKPRNEIIVGMSSKSRWLILVVSTPLVILVAVGGLIFGAGFAISGYCPGTCVVGIAEGRRDGLVALLGGVVGALAFSFAYKALEGSLIKPLSYGKITWADVFGAPPVVVALALGLIMLVAVRFLPTSRTTTSGR